MESAARSDVSVLSWCTGCAEKQRVYVYSAYSNRFNIRYHKLYSEESKDDVYLHIQGLMLNKSRNG